VINYGGSTDKIVVYYGTNDGVFHAVNGNQTAAIGSIPAGDELWGLVLTDHYPLINRQRIASPELRFPTTLLASATGKDYFVDGPTGAYQKLNSDGTINTAYIYLTMRRGGRFVYALDVSNPQTPKFLWKIDTTTTGFSELGQTWSRPRLTLLQSSTYKTTPVLIFGAGYDPSEDSEPPGTDTMGRGIYIVNAVTGALIWSATPTCTTSATCLQVPGMTYAIPSDVAFVDRDNDGFTDKLYVGDTGGNVWRVDVADAATTNWQVTKIAALGCDTGVCASGTTPRKFFFPPAILSIKAAGATGSYDAISVESGDREHPLKSTNTSSAYFTVDRFFMIMDQTTTVNPSTYITSNVTKSSLVAITSGNALWDGSGGGFYITFATGEKGVNAPLAVNGSIFFSTNQPADPSATCIPNLGTARAYAVSPFTGQSTSNVLSGGGLPPSPVAGLVSVTTGSVTTEERFCIGCGLATPPGTTGGTTTCSGNAALQNCTPAANISSNLKRTYWYKK
jgi:type IV pilus assembly protein PilY1